MTPSGRSRPIWRTLVLRTPTDDPRAPLTDPPEITSGAYWPAPLADYDNPPVVETVLAVHFEPLAMLSTVRILDFWRSHLYKLGFHEASDQERHVVPLEQFGPAPAGRGVRMNVLQVRPGPRWWFVNKSGEDLVQVQDDWLALNWRKLDENERYRPYSEGRERFAEIVESLAEFCDRSSIGPINPIQAEATYFNHIRVPGTPSGDVPNLDRILRPISDHRVEGLPEPESASFSVRYVARDEAGNPSGRLHVVARPGFTGDPKDPMVILEMTFRGRVKTSNLAGVQHVHDQGHAWIVGSFDEMTTSEMATTWGRKERQ